MGAMTKRGNGLFVGAGLALKLVQRARDPVSYDMLDQAVQGEARNAAWSKCKLHTCTNSFFAAAFFVF